MIPESEFGLRVGWTFLIYFIFIIGFLIAMGIYFWWGERTKTPCDTCKYRQRDLDPEGCFKQVSTTGLLARVWMFLTDCPAYQVMP